CPSWPPCLKIREEGVYESRGYSGGEIRIGGRKVNHVPPYRRNLGVVFQNYALFPHMTVNENLAFPLESRGWDRARIERAVSEALARVRLDGLGARRPSQLSGGQQQRVALARALVFNPPVLLMDEPLSALDKKLREEMQLEIKHIQQEIGITVVYVTHDQAEALTMSDRIAVMNHGRIVQLGAPADLYERPANRFVADFIGETNLIDVASGRDDGGTPVGDAGDGVRFRLPEGEGIAPGGGLTLGLRPERVMVTEGAAPEDGRDWREARVEEVVYIGEVRRYLLRLGPILIVAKQQTGSGVSAFAAGQSVRVGWFPDDLRIVEGAAE
ncbi:MAG: ABC transporter ATP-binding protein, partial [Proteobacteria bacterium]|nr:ABC transporter ATP-binding protein [Pseudomonadota bacterium]